MTSSLDNIAGEAAEHIVMLCNDRSKDWLNRPEATQMVRIACLDYAAAAVKKATTAPNVNGGWGLRDMAKSLARIENGEEL